MKPNSKIMRSKYSPQKAFTLIELSIVLIIVGLLIGGVLLGRDLIKTATIQRHISDIRTLRTAINTFKLQYDAMPGDFNQASTMWPSVTCGGGHCNGNGDQLSSTGSETIRFWVHLSSAGLIEGTYTGDWQPGVLVGEEVPLSAFGNNIGLWQEYRVLGTGGIVFHLYN